MMTKLEMPVSGTGSTSATAALLVSGGTPTTSRMITSGALPLKSEDPMISPISPSTTVLDSTHSLFGASDANPDNGSAESDDLGPVSRDRCNTWPLRRTQMDLNAQTSPLIHEQILEEETDCSFDSEEGRLTNVAMMGSPENIGFSPGMPSPPASAVGSTQIIPSSAASDTSDNGLTSKKSTTRRNAWGNMSYADLITQAIISSPEKRLTLSQVYEWMVQNVPYFRDKGDSNSSAGWKFTLGISMSLMNSVNDDDSNGERNRCHTWPAKQFNFCFKSPDQQSSSATTTLSETKNITPVCSSTGEQTLPQNDGHLFATNHYVQSESSLNHTRGTSSQYFEKIQSDDFYGLSGSEDNICFSKLKKKRIRKKPSDAVCQKKPNPWGEESYSDLIARALETAPEKRMKLSDIYLWFSANIPYFQERSSNEEAAGWKNSIRHNLSLHSRFMRIQNEGAGKSSWWVINPDAKPGRNPRRQRAATMESTTKAALEKKRRGARKKVLELRTAGSLQSTPGSLVSSQASVANHDLFGDNEDSVGNFDPVFRPRTQSNLSVTSRVSPSVGPGDFHEDFDFPPFVEASAMPNDILDRTNEITLSQGDTSAYQPLLNSTNSSATAAAQPSLLQHVKAEERADGIKTDLDSVQPPPSYHVLNNARDVSHSQNPLLSSSIVHRSSQQSGMAPSNGLYSSTTHGLHWISGGIRPQISCAQQTLGQAGLPMDLENLTLPEQPFMDCDMETVIRQELSQSTSNQLTFD